MSKYILVLFLTGSPQPMVAPVDAFTTMPGCLCAGMVEAPGYVNRNWPGRELERTACVPEAHLEGYLLRYGRKA